MIGVVETPYIRMSFLISISDLMQIHLEIVCLHVLWTRREINTPNPMDQISLRFANYALPTVAMHPIV